MMSGSCRWLAFVLGGVAATPSVADETWWASTYLAATLSDSHLTGSAAQTMRLDDGTAVQPGIALSREATFAGHRYGVLAQAGNASWSAADGTQLLLGVDYLWEDKAHTGGGVYLGPRLGVLEFEEEVTYQSDTSAAYGYEFGFRQPFLEGSMALGLFYQRLYIDVDNQLPAGAGRDLGVSVDRLDSLGIRLSWRL